ncbi:hypothetical protein BJV74DRAFT_264561 [Russula compacta]|nr:hypothetical protein BJV74DRAFT_264561 [Russula compacta]
MSFPQKRQRSCGPSLRQAPLYLQSLSPLRASKPYTSPSTKKQRNLLTGPPTVHTSRMRSPMLPTPRTTCTTLILRASTSAGMRRIRPHQYPRKTLVTSPPAVPTSTRICPTSWKKASTSGRLMIQNTKHCWRYKTTAITSRVNSRRGMTAPRASQRHETTMTPGPGLPVGHIATMRHLLSLPLQTKAQRRALSRPTFALQLLRQLWRHSRHLGAGSGRAHRCSCTSPHLMKRPCSQSSRQ